MWKASRIRLHGLSQLGKQITVHAIDCIRHLSSGGSRPEEYEAHTRQRTAKQTSRKYEAKG